MAFNLISSRTSVSSRKSLDMAERITRSASLSSLSISSQVLIAASAVAGWLQLYKHYCVKKRRLDCTIGCHILKREANFDTPINKTIFEIQEEEFQYARA